jgi:parallel beta-helix repeat protein
VSFEDTRNSTVTRMILQDNLGNGDYGDGVSLFGTGSTGNTITGNVARHNGPYDGIGMIQGASGNTISNNLVENNNFTIQDSGIRIEGPGSKNNTVTGNDVRGSSLDGIEGFRFANTNTGSIITRNLVTANGRHGIVLFGTAAAPGASNSTVNNNIVQNNRGDGINVQSLNNTLNTNRASGNLGLDLRDQNPNCDNNAWHGNTGATFTPPCVLNP